MFGCIYAAEMPGEIAGDMDLSVSSIMTVYSLVSLGPWLVLVFAASGGLKAESIASFNYVSGSSLVVAV